jgi:hypothetical protein
MMGNINEGKGVFAPLVVITRNIVGKKQFNQLRGKAIALHSQVSISFFWVFFRVQGSGLRGALSPVFLGFRNL